jgi:PKD repeat protein
VGAAFAYQIVADEAPSSYSATGLPAGLGLFSATGLISGIPKTAGVYPVTLRATNAAGTGTASLVITVAASTASAGLSATVTESSSPGGFLSRTSSTTVGSVYTTSTASTTSGNYSFTGWKLNGTRLVDVAGRAQNPATFTVTGNASLTAEYILTTADADGDGLRDAFETEFFGNLLQGALADSDGDSFSNQLEFLLGFDPGLFDTVIEGGIARRTTAVATLIFESSYFKVTVNSSPAG